MPRAVALVRVATALVPTSVRIAVVLLPLSIPYIPRLAAQTQLQSTAESCANFADSFRNTNDLVMLHSYRSAIRGLAEHEDFQQLDCIADSIRSNKTRFPGGEWQLFTFYRGVSEAPVRATDEDWNDLIGHLQKWPSANPKSITAPVALAEAYINFAWYARGHGYFESVTGSGWRLFTERIGQAKKILDDASSLPGKCPHWYVSMQSVAKAQEWDLAKCTALFKEATAFAPDYHYYYRSHANNLLPKWEGEDGDASRFAEQSSNALGGIEGDIMYFRIGEGIVCACEEPELSRLSWPRLQQGYEAIRKEYGSSLAEVNVLALMATKRGDSVAADAAFQRIGDDFDIEKWNTEEFFRQSKTWASQLALVETRSRVKEQEADANLLSPTGPPYQKEIEQALGLIVQECAWDDEDSLQFEVMLEVGADGIAKDAWIPHPTSIGNCILKNIYDSNLKKKILFPPPPHADYWIKVTVDPGASMFEE